MSYCARLWYWCLFASSVCHSENAGSLITGYSALFQFVLSSECNFTNYCCNTYFNTNASLHFASAKILANVFRMKLVINSDYFLKLCWLNLCNRDVVCFMWSRIQIFTSNILKTKRNLLCIRNQSVPHSKHCLPRI
jgi:hypothetical protein